VIASPRAFDLVKQIQRRLGGAGVSIPPGCRMRMVCRERLGHLELFCEGAQLINVNQANPG
jgi:hypothetical protein